MYSSPGALFDAPKNRSSDSDIGYVSSRSGSRLTAPGLDMDWTMYGEYPEREDVSREINY